MRKNCSNAIAVLIAEEYPTMIGGTKMQQVTISTVGLTHQDGYSWRKYGQKPIVNAKHPREYYRCGHRDQGCKATKQVQIISDNPTQYKIIYLGKHTCRHRPMDASNYEISDSVELESGNMLSFSDSDRPAICSLSHQDLINELAVLSRNAKHLPTDHEKEEKLKRPKELDLPTHAEAIPLRADAGSVNTEAISKEIHKELATEETSSVEELQGDTNFQPIDDINVLKENTPTSSDQVLPRVTQDVNYVCTVNTVAQLMEEDETSTSNQLVEELEAKVELLKKRAEDAEGKLEKEHAAWQRAKDRYERRAIDAENEISDLEKKLDEAWTEKAELKASVAAATKQMRFKCLDLMKRALAEYDKQISWNQVLRQFLYLEQQSDKDTPEVEPNKGKNRSIGSRSHPRETGNNEKEMTKEKNVAVQEDEADSTPEYSLNTLTMTRLAL
ncbi:hypothetical protein Cgig2_014996 [Carnegiea gigantea]|uniref:WRKY domain-containing protein n=1 Tax=Carnegiea gigantea TaxID=171969 RepID=A0A9Q1JQF1_9CARY|nr:hypothetical protein Cgig2_014996 [Carnegiea gigantea]